MSNDPGPVQFTTPTLPGETAEEPGIYRYEPSGIRERSGHVPVWLKLVAFGLIVWGILYAMRYWNSY